MPRGEIEPRVMSVSWYLWTTHLGEMVSRTRRPRPLAVRGPEETQFFVKLQRSMSRQFFSPPIPSFRWALPWDSSSAAVADSRSSGRFDRWRWRPPAPAETNERR